MISTSVASVYRLLRQALTAPCLGTILSVSAASCSEAADVFQESPTVVTDAGTEHTTTLFPIIKDRRMGFIDRDGDVLIEPMFLLSHTGPCRIRTPETIRMIGDDPSPDVYDPPSTGYPIRFPIFHDGVVMVFTDEGIGYIRRDGKVLAPPMFRAGADFCEKVAWAQSADQSYCLLDTEGRRLIEGVEECSPFCEGIAAIKLGGKYGYIDRRGTIVVAPLYDSASAFSDNVACVGIGAEQWLINCQGKQIARVEGRVSLFSEGMAVVYDKITGTYGYIDRDGKQIVSPRFARAEPFHEGLAVVELHGKCGFIDRTGDFAIQPRFDDAKGFSNGLAIVCVRDPERPNRLCQGIVNWNGDYVMEPEYESIRESCDGFTIVKAVGSGFGLTDSRGRYVLEPQFTDLFFTSDSRLVAGKDRRYILLDLRGKPILPSRYCDISLTLGQGLRYVASEIEGRCKFGYLDAWGNMAIPPRFDYAENFESGLARVAVDIELYIPEASAVCGGKWGYVDRSGKWVWEPTR